MDLWIRILQILLCLLHVYIYAHVLRNYYPKYVVSAYTRAQWVCARNKSTETWVENCNGVAVWSIQQQIHVRSVEISTSKPTGCLMHQQFNIQQLYPLPTLYLCFVFIWEQTATCATYSINWLVFITEMKSVYSAVRTGSLNKAVCASSLNG